jgi:hypothetical protein
MTLKNADGTVYKYDTSSIYIGADGNIYLWLPQGTKISEVHSGDTKYPGEYDVTNAAGQIAYFGPPDTGSDPPPVIPDDPPPGSEPDDDDGGGGGGDSGGDDDDSTSDGSPSTGDSFPIMFFMMTALLSLGALFAFIGKHRRMYRN